MVEATREAKFVEIRSRYDPVARAALSVVRTRSKIIFGIIGVGRRPRTIVEHLERHQIESFGVESELVTTMDATHVVKIKRVAARAAGE